MSREPGREPRRHWTWDQLLVQLGWAAHCAWTLRLQASSFKLDSWSGMCYYRIIKEKYMDNDNLKRIADILEEILRLVKEDQERMKKLND